MIDRNKRIVRAAYEQSIVDLPNTSIGHDWGRRPICGERKETAGSVGWSHATDAPKYDVKELVFILWARLIWQHYTQSFTHSLSYYILNDCSELASCWVMSIHCEHHAQGSFPERVYSLG